MTKGWSPRASDITVSVSELCELSTALQPAYPGRKCLVIDYARRTFGSSAALHGTRLMESLREERRSANDLDIVSTSLSREDTLA